MTDLEIMKLCAAAMGNLPAMIEHEGEMRFGYKGCMGPAYNPLKDGAQAMALVVSFKLQIDPPDGDGDWGVTHYDDDGNNPICGCDKSLLRAICECVARMQAASE
ncbi:MAG TPA: hypothetical protein VK663_00035 [Burkholderiales bacterium]|nr:hypothetical protein [Burkholderiales bacterium]